MILQNIIISLILLISGIALTFIFDKLKLNVTKIVFITFLVLLLFSFPLLYLDNKLIVKFIQLLFNNYPEFYELFSIYLAKTLTASTSLIFLVALIMLSLAFVMFVVLLIVTLRATYKLISIICELFKSKPTTPKVEIEKHNLPRKIIFNDDEKNLYLKFCRLLN